MQLTKVGGTEWKKSTVSNLKLSKEPAIKPSRKFQLEAQIIKDSTEMEKVLGKMRSKNKRQYVESDKTT